MEQENLGIENGYVNTLNSNPYVGNDNISPVNLEAERLIREANKNPIQPAKLINIIPTQEQAINGLYKDDKIKLRQDELNKIAFEAVKETKQPKNGSVAPELTPYDETSKYLDNSLGKELGYYKGRDNDTYYDENQTVLGDIARVTTGVGIKTIGSFIGGVASLPILVTQLSRYAKGSTGILDDNGDRSLYKAFEGLGDNSLQRSINQYSNELDTKYATNFNNQREQDLASDSSSWNPILNLVPFYGNGFGDSMKSFGYTLGAMGAFGLEELLTGGFATPAILAQGVGYIGKLAGKISGALKATERVEKMLGGLQSLGFASKALNTVDTAISITNNTKKIITGFDVGLGLKLGVLPIAKGLVGGLNEASMEGLETKENLYNSLVNEYTTKNGYEPSDEEKLDMKNISNEAKNVRFGVNLAILGVSNAITFNNIFKNFPLTKALIGKVEKEEFKLGFEKSVAVIKDTVKPVSELAKSPKWYKSLIGKTYDATRNNVVGLLSVNEGIEEGLQTITQKATDNYYTYKYNTGNDFDLNKIYESTIKATKDTLTSNDGWNAILQGIIGGAIGGVASKGIEIYQESKPEYKKQQLEKRQTLQKYVNFLNSPEGKKQLTDAININSLSGSITSKTKDLYTTKGIANELENAVKSNERSDFHNHKHAFKFQYIDGFLKLNQESVLDDQLNDLEKLASENPDEFKKAFGLDLESVEQKSPVQIVQELKDYKKVVKKERDNINLAFTNQYQPSVSFEEKAKYDAYEEFKTTLLYSKLAIQNKIDRSVIVTQELGEHQTLVQTIFNSNDYKKHIDSIKSDLEFRKSLKDDEQNTDNNIEDLQKELDFYNNLKDKKATPTEILDFVKFKTNNKLGFNQDIETLFNKHLDVLKLKDDIKVMYDSFNKLADVDGFNTFIEKENSYKKAVKTQKIAAIKRDEDNKKAIELNRIKDLKQLLDDKIEKLLPNDVTMLDIQKYINNQLYDKFLDKDYNIKVSDEELLKWIDISVKEIQNKKEADVKQKESVKESIVVSNPELNPNVVDKKVEELFNPDTSTPKIIDIIVEESKKISKDEFDKTVSDEFKGKVIIAPYGTGKSTLSEKSNIFIDGDNLMQHLLKVVLPYLKNKELVVDNKIKLDIINQTYTNTVSQTPIKYNKKSSLFIFELIKNTPELQDIVYEITQKIIKDNKSLLLSSPVYLQKETKLNNKDDVIIVTVPKKDILDENNNVKTEQLLNIVSNRQERNPISEESLLSNIESIESLVKELFTNNNDLQNTNVKSLYENQTLEDIVTGKQIKILTDNEKLEIINESVIATPVELEEPIVESSLSKKFSKKEEVVVEPTIPVVEKQSVIPIVETSVNVTEQITVLEPQIPIQPQLSSQITEKFIEDNNTSELTSLLFTDSSDFFIKDDGSIGVTKGNVVSTDTNTVQVTNAKNNNDFKTIRNNIRKAKINFFKDIFYFINSDIKGEIKNNIKNYTVKTLNYISKTGSQPRLITNHKGLFRTSVSQYFTIVNKEGVVAYTLPLNYNIFYEDKDGSYKLFIDPNKEFSEREYNDIINGFGNKDKSFKHSYSYQQYKKERLDYINLMTVVNSLANSNLTNEDKINKFIELTNINLTNYGVIKNKSENVNNNFVKFNDIIPLPYINYTEDTESGQELINPLIVVQEVEELNTDTNVRSKSLNMFSGNFTKGLSPEFGPIIKQKLKAWYDKQMTKENPFDFGNSFHLVALDSITNEPTFVRFENEDITQQVTDNINTLTNEYKPNKTVTWITFDVDDSFKNFKLFFYKDNNNNWGIKISKKTPSRRIKDNVIPAKIEDYFLPIDMSKEPQKSWIKIDKSERIEREILEIPKDINLTEFLLQDLVDTHNNTLKEYQKEQLELTKKLKDATFEERKSIKSTIKLGILKTKVFENNNQIEPFIKSIEKSLINKSFKMVDNTPASKINNNNGVSSLKNRTKIKADNEFIFKTVCLTVKAKQQIISTTINPIVEPIIEKVKQEPVINEPVIAAINNQVNDNQLDNDFQDIISKFDNLKQLNTEQIKYLESIYEIKLPKISYAPDKTVVALDKDVLKQLNLEKLNLKSIQFLNNFFSINKINDISKHRRMMVALNTEQQVYDEIDTVPFTRTTTSVENELEQLKEECLWDA